MFDLVFMGDAHRKNFMIFSAACFFGLICFIISWLSSSIVFAFGTIVFVFFASLLTLFVDALPMRRSTRTLILEKRAARKVSTERNRQFEEDFTAFERRVDGNPDMFAWLDDAVAELQAFDPAEVRLAQAYVQSHIFDLVNDRSGKE